MHPTRAEEPQRRFFIGKPSLLRTGMKILSNGPSSGLSRGETMRPVRHSIGGEQIRPEIRLDAKERCSVTDDVVNHGSGRFSS